MEILPSRGPRVSPLRLILVAAGVLLAAVLLIQQLSRLFADRSIMPPDDFVEYWAAGRLNAHGENPYDPDKLFPLEKEAGRTALPLDAAGNETAVMMWNPPWTLTLVMPLGLLDARLGQLLWLLLNVGIILFCADWAWRYYQGPASYRWLGWTLALTFVPSLIVLRAGQIGPLILLGIVGFLHFERKAYGKGGMLSRPDEAEEKSPRSNEGRESMAPGQFPLLLAGAVCVLIAIKPHLVFLFWIAVGLWAVERRRWPLLIGGIVTGLITTAIPMLCNPNVCQQYWDAVGHHPPEEWVSLTIGSILRLVFGEDRFWLQVVPAIPALIWFGFHWWKHHRTWNWGEQMPLLMLLSFLTTFYGAWPFDLVILLLPVIQAAVWSVSEPRLRVPALVIYLAIDLLALALNLASVTSIWFIWMTPALLAGYLSLRAMRS